ILAPDINSGGAVYLIMVDGQLLLSNPMGLAFYDASNGKSVLIAEVTNCIGELVAPNVVFYPNAFDTLKGGIRYTYTKAGFEQDIILYEDPGSPADYGLNPETTRLEIWTEFFNPPAPRKVNSITPDNFYDEQLDFGKMSIGPGKAFALNEIDQA